MDTVNAGFTASAARDPNKFLIGRMPVYTRDVVIASGQNLVAGTVLGKITSGGKFIKSLSAASDGSQTPKAILQSDCDASGGDTTARVYIAGDFKANRLTIGTAHTAASIGEALAALGIYLFDEQVY